MIGLDISEVLADFPDTRVALVVASELDLEPERTPALARADAEVEAEVGA